MVDNGILHKLNKKYYENTQYSGEESDFYYVSAYAPKGVVCLMSAAAYYNLTTFRPDTVDVAIRRNAKISTMPEWPEISVFYYAKDRFETGIETVQEGKNQFKIYNIEKTVVDVVIDCDDALLFDLESLDVINITEFNEYHGVKVSIIGHLERTKVPISIDIGFDDIVYPSRVKMTFPVLLDMEVPEIYAYAIDNDRDFKQHWDKERREWI